MIATLIIERSVAGPLIEGKASGEPKTFDVRALKQKILENAECS